MDITISHATKPDVYHWRLEVKGLNTGKWIATDESRRRTREAAEREFRSGMHAWVFEKREWRIVPV